MPRRDAHRSRASSSAEDHPAEPGVVRGGPLVQVAERVRLDPDVVDAVWQTRDVERLSGQVLLVRVAPIRPEVPRGSRSSSPSRTPRQARRSRAKGWRRASTGRSDRSAPSRIRPCRSELPSSDPREGARTVRTAGSASAGGLAARRSATCLPERGRPARRLGRSTRRRSSRTFRVGGIPRRGAGRSRRSTRSLRSRGSLDRARGRR